MKKITIMMEVVFTIPEKNLTINSLIQGIKDAKHPILESIMATLMKAFEEALIEKMLLKNPGRYKRNGHENNHRKLKTSLGTIRYRFAQLLDCKGNKPHTIVPLKQFLSIPEYNHYLDESLEPAIGLCVHTSYRRSTSEIERIQGTTMGHTTVHRRLQVLAAQQFPFGNMKRTPFRFLLVDGTKVHLQGPKGADLGQKEMRWALASTGPGKRFVPVGFWINTTWKQIRKDLNKCLSYKKLKVLFSDGGPGIAESLLHSTMKQQRCLWHGRRDFPYLLYNDGYKKDEQTPLIEKLASIPAMGLNKQTLEKLRPEDRPQIQSVLEQTREGFKELLELLTPEKYPKARAYIENLIKPVTTFLQYWLRHGKAIPLTTNAIECAFSQVSNRIKHIGRRWSEKGLLNWLRITFYKIFKPDQWQQIWLDKERKLEKITLTNICASYCWG